jgi:hypothetical protein
VNLVDDGALQGSLNDDPTELSRILGSLGVRERFNPVLDGDGIIYHYRSLNEKTFLLIANN